MKYRQGSPSDAPVLARMNQELIRDEGHRNPMTLAQLEERMNGWLQREYVAVLFEDEDGAAGYALYRRDPEWVYLRQFFVQPHCRRRGVGRAAMEWLMANVWRNEPRVRLEVLIGNTIAIQFWRSVGFADYCLTMERPGVQTE